MEKARIARRVYHRAWESRNREHLKEWGISYWAKRYDAGLGQDSSQARQDIDKTSSDNLVRPLTLQIKDALQGGPLTVSRLADALGKHPEAIRKTMTRHPTLFRKLLSGKWELSE
jgi:hypothetical protein